MIIGRSNLTPTLILFSKCTTQRLRGLMRSVFN